MSKNPQFGTTELAQNQSQPHVPINTVDRAISAGLAGEIILSLVDDDDLVLGDSQWAYATIIITDTDEVLTAARDVIYPDVDALTEGTSRMRFEFVNRTSFALTIKREDATGVVGVTVPGMSSALVRHDGTDIVLVATGDEETGTGGPGGVLPIEIQVALSDMTTNLTAGAGKAYVRAPAAFTLDEVRASLFDASSAGGPVTVDINVNGSTILSTKLTIDDTEFTSVTAGTPPVISDPDISSDDEIAFDIDDPGTDAKGLIVTLIGTRV